ncbi:MAG: hypothetical protein KDD51_03205 [Bdellovibrionales bacterium]|nr:hypothetical protein [Bdellovibrionales bacterium]
MGETHNKRRTEAYWQPIMEGALYGRHYVALEGVSVDGDPAILERHLRTSLGFHPELHGPTSRIVPLESNFQHAVSATAATAYVISWWLARGRPPTDDALATLRSHKTILLEAISEPNSEVRRAWLSMKNHEWANPQAADRYVSLNRIAEALSEAISSPAIEILPGLSLERLGILQGPAAEGFFSATTDEDHQVLLVLLSELLQRLGKRARELEKDGLVVPGNLEELLVANNEDMINALVVSWRDDVFASRAFELYRIAAAEGRDAYLRIGAGHLDGVYQRLLKRLPESVIGVVNIDRSLRHRVREWTAPLFEAHYDGKGRPLLSSKHFTDFIGVLEVTRTHFPPEADFRVEWDVADDAITFVASYRGVEHWGPWVTTTAGRERFHEMVRSQVFMTQLLLTTSSVLKANPHDYSLQLQYQRQLRGQDRQPFFVTRLPLEQSTSSEKQEH